MTTEAPQNDDWRLLEVLKHLDELESQVDEYARLREVCPEESVTVNEIEACTKRAERSFMAAESILTRNLINTIPLSQKPLPPLPKTVSQFESALAAHIASGSSQDLPPTQPKMAQFSPLTCLAYTGAVELKAKMRDPAKGEVPHRLVLKGIESIVESLR